MTSRLSALLVWGLAVASAVFWGLRLMGSPAPVPAQAQVALHGGLPAGDLSRLLGAAPAVVTAAQPLPPAVASRFVLTGVVATPGPRGPQAEAAPGVALLAVDGKPARAYRVGDALDERLVLRSVGLRSAHIGASDGSGEFVLELPKPSPAATGVPGGAVVPVGGVPAMPVFSPAPMTPPPSTDGAPMQPPPGLPQGAAAMTPPPGMTAPPVQPRQGEAIR
jgi:general secretion pathway protein C